MVFLFLSGYALASPQLMSAVSLLLVRRASAREHTKLGKSCACKRLSIAKCFVDRPCPRQAAIMLGEWIRNSHMLPRKADDGRRQISVPHADGFATAGRTLASAHPQETTVQGKKI